MLEREQNEVVAKPNLEDAWRGRTSLRWTVQGPEDSPYEGGRFVLEITVPEEFPAVPPEVACLTEIWHPNISAGPGHFPLFVKLWEDSHTLRWIVCIFQTLLRCPDPGDSENASAWQQFRTDRSMFDRTARFWTATFAGGKVVDHELAWKTKALLRAGFSHFRAVQLLSIFDWDDARMRTITSSDLGRLKNNK